MSEHTNQPSFTAITSSTRHIFLLLRCIGFLPMALCSISDEGVRFSVEDSRSMQGHVILERHLFTTYNFTPPELDSTSRSGKREDDDDDDMDEDEPPQESQIKLDFSINLAALLECLQIFGGDSQGSKSSNSGSVFNSINRSGPNAIFDQGPMRATGTCRMIYEGQGKPLCIILEEGGVTTTCELTTYQPDAQSDIPLDRSALMHRIIIKGSWLHDAIQELDSSSAEILVILISPNKPYFVLSSVGHLGSASVEFSNERNLMEKFDVVKQSHNRYRFSMLRAAIRAMAMATKVSMRTDLHGVLSFQFMIEGDGSQAVFIDFRFLPLRADELDDEGNEKRQDQDEAEDDDEEKQEYY